MSLLLKIALGLCYFGEYASLIGILEKSRAFGSISPVLMYGIYSVPPIFLILLSHLRPGLFLTARKTLPWTMIIGSAILIPISKASTLQWLAVGILFVAILKQVIKLLALNAIKQAFKEDDRQSLLSSVVGLRFVVMILGASAGGFLMSSGKFELVILLHALCYLVAAGLLLARKNLWASMEDLHSEPTLVASTGGILQGFQYLFSSFNLTFLAVVMLCWVSIGSFMALEYPILTTDLAIDPSLLFLVYIGHVAGAILAQKACALLKIESPSAPLIATAVVGLAASFGFVGSLSTNLMWISLQLGVCAFFMPVIEIYYSGALMVGLNKQRYAHASLALNLIIETSSIIGSFITLPFVAHSSPIDVNQLLQTVYAVAAIATLGFATQSVRKTAPIALASALMIGVSAVGKPQLNSNPLAKHIDLQNKVTEFYKDAIADAETLLNSYVQKLSESILSPRTCEKTPGTQNKYSSFYVPDFSHDQNAVECFRLNSQSLGSEWEDVINRKPYVSWIYTYDSGTGAFRISPSTDTRALYGPNLSFNRFSFFTTAVTHPGRSVWGDYPKDDVNGTGQILVISRALDLPSSLQPVVVAIDINVQRLLNTMASKFLELSFESKSKTLHVFSYMSFRGNRFPAGNWTSNPSEWNQLSSNQGKIMDVSSKEALVLENLEIQAEHRGQAMQKLSLRGKPETCSVSYVKRPGIFIWICSEGI